MADLETPEAGIVTSALPVYEREGIHTHHILATAAGDGDFP